MKSALFALAATAASVTAFTPVNTPAGRLFQTKLYKKKDGAAADDAPVELPPALGKGSIVEFTY